MPMNYAKTALLLAVLTAIFVVLGAAVGGKAGLVVAFAVALVMNVVSLWKSDQIVLRMFNAQEVERGHRAPSSSGSFASLPGRPIFRCRASTS